MAYPHVQQSSKFLSTFNRREQTPPPLLKNNDPSGIPGREHGLKLRPKQENKAIRTKKPTLWEEYKATHLLIRKEKNVRSIASTFLLLLGVLTGLIMTIFDDRNDTFENMFISLGVAFALVYIFFPELLNFSIIDVLLCFK